MDLDDEARLALDGFYGLVLTRLGRIEARIGEGLMAAEGLKLALDKISAAADNIAADVKNLKNQIAQGMTPEEVEAAQKTADDLVTRLEGLAAETPDVP